ncbi:MAG: hypothetical protein WCI04_05870 [archaeon]
MNHKGQTAFEALFVFIIVISSAIMLLSLYSSISEDTIALSTARAETNKQLAMQKTNIEIIDVNIKRIGGEVNIWINLSQNTTLDLTTIKESIKANTAFKNIKINGQ